MTELVGYDIDGVLTADTKMESDAVIISGRTFAEYDDTCKRLAAQVPVYIRGSGAFGDRQHAGRFKAEMIRLLGVTTFYEDDPLQASIITDVNPRVLIVLLTDVD